ncbi:MAG TPA: hypothetical protein VN917_05455, partial [Xanthobacteraceae bacterium]|nr:hypothetical protein [Xanthobacteraceae bacterium]
MMLSVRAETALSRHAPIGMVDTLARRRSIRTSSGSEQVSFRRASNKSGNSSNPSRMGRSVVSGALEVVKEMKVFGRFARRRAQDSWRRPEAMR